MLEIILKYAYEYLQERTPPRYMCHIPPEFYYQIKEYAYNYNHCIRLW
jgi:hypothetical protein